MSDLATSDLYQSLRPAQRVAALSALKAAIDEQLKEEKQRVLDLAAEVGVKSFATEFGAVGVSQKDAPILIDEVKLLDWVKERTPELVQTIEVIPDWYAAQLSNPKFMQVVDGEVFDQDGTQLPYASVGEKGAPYVAWPSSKEQKAGKAQASEFVRGNVAQISAAVLGFDVPTQVSQLIETNSAPTPEASVSTAPAAVAPAPVPASASMPAPAIAPTTPGAMTLTIPDEPIF